MKKATVFFTLALAALILFVSCGEDPFFHIVKVVNGDKTTETIVRNGDEYTLPENDSEGFQGWKVNDEESLRKPGEKITIKKDTTVKAVFPGDDDAPVVIRMTYVLRDFEGNFEGEFKDDSVQTVIEDVEKVTLLKESDLNIPTGASFDGWYTEEDKDGNRAYYKGGEEITITGDTKVYAHWTDNNLSYTVSEGDNPIVTVAAKVKDAASYKISEWYQGNKVTVIGDFSSATKLTSITLPDMIKTISDKAFDECASLTSCDLPSKLETIGFGAFDECNLTGKIVIPASVTSIGSAAFDENANLTEVEFEEGSAITAIPSTCFKGCGLTSFPELPASVTSLGYSCFSDNKFETLVIPASVTEIGQYAFFNCDSLTSVEIKAESATVISDYAFASSDALSTVTIGSGISSIGDAAFRATHNLTVTIGSGISSIHDNAFQDCSNVTVKIMKTATEIKSTLTNYATKWNCSSLTIKDKNGDVVS